jgi:hypothetical protein
MSSKDKGSGDYERELSAELSRLRTTRDVEKAAHSMERLARIVALRLIKIAQENRSMLLIAFDQKYNANPRSNTMELLEIHHNISLELARLIPVLDDPENDDESVEQAA